MSWFDFVVAYLVGAVFLLGPGYAFLAAARVPAWFRLLLSPIVSAAWVATLGIVFAWTGIRFGPASVIVATVVVAGVVAALVRLTPPGRWLTADRDPEQADEARTPLGVWLALGAAMLVSFGVWLQQYVRPLSGPAAVTNGYDVPWHAAIIKQFVATGNASTLTSATVDHTVGSTFYPTAWHAMVALVVDAGNYPIFGGINAVVTGELTLVWPLSITALVTVLLGRRPATALLAGVLGSLFVAFPLHMLTWGIVYSNIYGDALLPALLALCVLLLSSRVGAGLGRPMVAILVLVAVVGAAIAQPNTVFTTVLFILPMLLGVVYRSVAAMPRTTPRPRLAGLLACLGLVVIVAGAWVGLAHTKAMARTVDDDWRYVGGLLDAVKAALFEGFSQTRYQAFLAALVIAGALVLLLAWRRQRWLLVSHALLSFCYIVSASLYMREHMLWLRGDLTGYWYNDFNRLAAATVMTAIPLAVVAVEWIAVTVASYSRGRLPALATVAVVVVAALAGTLTSTQFRSHAALQAVRSSPNSELPGPRVHFLQRVSRIVPAGQAVANNPFDGSAYAYPLFGVDTFYKSYSANWIGTPSKAMRVIANHLDEAAHNATVCNVLRRYHVTYALQMTTADRLVQWHWRGQRMTPHTPGFRVVASAPGARLYKITACGLAG